MSVYTAPLPFTTYNAMDQQERIQAASKFLLQSPPGEINDVLNDVRDIIADDDALQAGALPSLREYNLDQFITADVPGSEHQVIVSEASRVKLESDEEGNEERFLDPKSKTTFLFDHLRLEASDPQPYEPEEEPEQFRLSLESATESYISNHYHDGVSCVFATPSSSTRYTIQIVANKYNPQNYWSGRWRSEYIIDTDSHTISGRVLVNVHYYEQGNVQLSTTHAADIPIPPSALPSDSPSSSPPASNKILALIEDFESRYQTALSDAYNNLAERTFKGLRRALPLTRQKLDWDKVLGYKLGAELVASRGAGAGVQQ